MSDDEARRDEYRMLDLLERQERDEPDTPDSPCPACGADDWQLGLWHRPSSDEPGGGAVHLWELFL